jgi:flavorubredoxin
MLPQMADILTYLKGLKPQNMIAAAFGSYGWSGEAVKAVEEILEEMKLERAGDGIRVKNVPNAEILERCHMLGNTMAEKVLSRL